MADEVYDRLARSDISVAELVRELRTRWGPEAKAGHIHQFVEEVARCIIGRDEVQVGEIRDGHFHAWRLEPWEADDKLTQGLLALDTFLEDNTKYVFHRLKT